MTRDTPPPARKDFGSELGADFRPRERGGKKPTAKKVAPKKRAAPKKKNAM
jgi:hypothetical protein